MEFEHLFYHIKKNILVSLTLRDNRDFTEEDVKPLIKYLDTVSPYEFTDYIVMTFPEPRLDFYKDADFNKMMEKGLTEMTKIQNTLGYYPIQIATPLLGQLEQFNIAILFMGLVFSMILALFVIISVILIYGLLLVNVEQKSFEIGIKRMVGQSKFGLVKDVIIQTLFFSIPGIIIAFAC